MILLLIDWFATHFDAKIPAAFTYTSSRMILAALTTLLMSIGLGPWMITKLYEMKVGQVIRVDECPLLGELHSKKKGVPTMGGLLIIVSMLASLFLWMDLTHIFTLILFLSTVVLGSVGAYDDYLKLKGQNAKGLSGRKKLAWQLGFSLVVSAYLFIPYISETLETKSFFSKPQVIKEVFDQNASSTEEELSVKEYATLLYIPFVKEPLKALPVIFMVFLTAFVITGTSNAVNLTDGLDGLAAGCLLMVAASLAFIGFLSNNTVLAEYLNILYIEGSGEIAVYLCAMMGACLGFLWYNGHPAQIFMGDTGSLALGGVIGTSAILLKRELLLAIIGGVFMIEALSVIIQVGSFKFNNGYRPFLCAPIHHHFEYKGWPETKVVLRFWIVSLLFALLGLASLKFQ
jgi:phospho-N-acetylmuramoyl-pentapeptide-transferase